MDLSNLAIADDASADMTLLHPVDGSPLLGEDGRPVTITLLSEDSEEYRKNQRAIINRRLSQRGARQGKYTAEMATSDALETLVASTRGWSKNFNVDGKPLEFTPQNVRELYRRFPWVQQQAEAFISDRTNFLMASSQTSSPAPRPTSRS